MSADFDELLANNVYSLISKMDDDEAEMFTRVLADEIYEDLVSKNQRLIARENRKIVAKNLKAAETVCKSLIEQGRDDEAVAVAVGVRSGIQSEIEIAKDNGKEPGWNKGADGKFTTPANVYYGGARRKMAPQKRVRSVKRVKTVDGVKTITPETQKYKARDTGFLSSDKKSRYYKDTGPFVQAQQDAARHVVDAAENVRRPLHNMAINEQAMWDHISPSGFAGANQASKETVSTLEQNRDREFDTERSSLDRTWNTMQSAGALAAGLGSAGTAVGVPGAQSVALAGQAAQMAGSIAPHGERIVGPSVRRTKYRYQGVERKPDKTLVQGITHAKQGVLAEKVSRMPKNQRDKISQALFSRTAKPGDFLDSEDNRLAAEKATINYLRERIPDARRNTLREGSGKIAPSEASSSAPTVRSRTRVSAWQRITTCPSSTPTSRR